MFLLVLGGSFAGYLASLKLSQRVQNLERYLGFVQAAETEIRFSALPVRDVVEQHGTQLAFLRQCAQLTREGIPFDKAWRQTACRAEGFSEKDRELLLRFGEGFGASDAEGQISHCRLTMELLHRRLEEAGEEKKQKGRLYRMLGVLGSLGTALLLC